MKPLQPPHTFLDRKARLAGLPEIAETGERRQIFIG
jgi:hypothetical protein